MILLSSVLVHQSYAKTNNIQYDTLPSKFSGTPSFCAKEPPADPNIPESLIPILMKRTKSSLDAWIGPLKSSGKRDSNWDVNYYTIPRDQQEKYDYTKCDVVISFLKSPPKGQNNVEILGIHYFKDGKNYIEIYYQGYGICETRTDVATYWYSCQQDSPKLIVAMEAILRHELGHSMGLGHYVSDEVLYHFGSGHPSSIMVPILDVINSPTHVPIDPELLEIMPVDLDKIRQIYGNGGWGNQKKSELITQQSETKTIQLKGKTIIEKISGTIPKNMYKKDQRLDVVLTKPDGNIKSYKVVVSSTGKYTYSFIIPDSMTPGKYSITLKYAGDEIRKIPYEIISLRK